MKVIKKAGSPYYYFDMTVGGKRRRISTKRTKKPEAERYAADRLKEALDAEQHGVIPEITLRAALFDHYLPYVAKRASHVHLKRYCATLVGDRVTADGTPIKGLGGGDIKFHQITKSMLRTYRVQRLASGMSEQSVDHELKCVRAAYTLIHEDYRVPTRLVVPLARVKGKARYLTEAEEKALLIELDPTVMRVKGGGVTQIEPLALMAKQRRMNYELAVMLLDTGCRFGEIAKLTWSMVDTDDWAFIRIWRSKVANGARLEQTERVKAVLQRRHAERGNHHLVFASWSLDRETVRTSTAAIRRAMKTIGINSPQNVAEFGRRDVRSLRDTFATKLRTNGMALDRIQELLGHSSPAMTQKYAHLAVSRASEEASAMLNRLNGK
ncbi:MAG: site-specific integrase [Devosia sp.]|nr:site-specific integrase [Devosia sp.]